MELMKYYAESNRKMLERLRGKQREIAKRMRITNLEASDCERERKNFCEV